MRYSIYPEGTEMAKPPFITRVKLRNYKSIAQCDVALGSLAILVGANGSGKSNFLDALALVSEAMNVPMNRAVRERYGIAEVLRRSPDRPNSFSIDLEFEIPDSVKKGRFGFEIVSKDKRSFSISKEYCAIHPVAESQKPLTYKVIAGEIVSTNLQIPLPPVPSDRLFITNASSMSGFAQAYYWLEDMDFYHFDLNEMREHRPPDEGDILYAPEGSNLAAVLGAIERDDPLSFERIQTYMRSIVPGLERVSRLEIPTVNRESVETIQFRHQFDDHNHPQIFTAINMSDGTLRALAVLAALLQSGENPPSLIGIEEVETALHPAAVGVLWDALTDGCERTQVIISTHSPDFLDRHDVPTEAILAFQMDAGRTQIGHVAESGRQLLQERLATPGELLRQRRLSPNEPLIYPQMPISFDS